MTPCALISALPIDVTGLTLVRFGVGMRLPVTTTSATSAGALAAAAAAAAALAWPAMSDAPQIIEDARRRVRTDLMFKVLILQRRPRIGGAAPHNGSVPGVETLVTGVLLGIAGNGQRDDTYRSIFVEHCLAKDTNNEITDRS